MICVLRKTAKNRDSKNQRAVQRERYRSGTGHRSGTVRAVQRGTSAVQDTKRGTERGTESAVQDTHISAGRRVGVLF
jgi:hypothetical protein